MCGRIRHKFCDDAKAACRTAHVREFHIEPIIGSFSPRGETRGLLPDPRAFVRGAQLSRLTAGIAARRVNACKFKKTAMCKSGGRSDSVGMRWNVMVYIGH